MKKIILGCIVACSMLTALPAVAQEMTNEMVAYFLDDFVEKMKADPAVHCDAWYNGYKVNGQRSESGQRLFAEMVVGMSEGPVKDRCVVIVKTINQFCAPSDRRR